MKKFIYIVATICFIVSLSSCGAGASIKNDNKDQVAGYTLKNKKELMKHKILHKKGKTLIALP
ncbi:MAG: hypothetical protein L3J09_00645 [Flavobacteriaceae bacterium]|nr:hypothetical protein [Flavobacteriaceae bacterium]